VENSEIILKSMLELLDGPTEKKLVQFLIIRTLTMSYDETKETVNLVIENLKDISVLYKSFYDAMNADRILEKVESMRHLK
jgi:hypothetical protein